MIRVLIPENPEFKYYEKWIKNLYEQNQNNICDSNTFDFVRDNTFFYLFLNNNKPLGAIYYFMDNSHLFLNGFSSRKAHLLNLACLSLSTTWFTGDIYAEAQNRASAFCLLKCGFKRLKDKLFVLKRG